jgi:hypothetical protein
VPVINDQYGLFGWCSDGVEEKVRNEGADFIPKTSSTVLKQGFNGDGAGCLLSRKQRRQP